MPDQVTISEADDDQPWGPAGERPPASTQRLWAVGDHTGKHTADHRPADHLPADHLRADHLRADRAEERP